MLNLVQAIEHQSTLDDIQAKAWIDSLPLKERINLAEQVAATQAALRKEHALLFYRPVSKEAEKFHMSEAQIRLVAGGNRSGKTVSNLVDMVIEMTGIVPYSLEGKFPKSRLRPPIRARLVVESLTNTWEPVIKPKLIYSSWNGKGEPGGPQGHWGWIPRHSLIKGKWDESWSEKNRTLTLTNGSTCQIMSYDQEVQDFSGSSLHTVRMDEGPPHSIYRENRMRIIDVNGNIAIAMTPPDDESASWDAAWVYDEIYEKGIVGPSKDPNIDAFTFFTEQNAILDRHEIDSISSSLTSRQREVRLFGRFMHLGGRVYTIYTDRPQWWCFACNDIMLNVDGKCTTCQNKNGVVFQHTVDPDKEDWVYKYPVVYLLDPHPRKPHMMAWVAITPADDWVVIKEMEIDGEPEIVRDKVFDFEKQFDLNIVKRIIDPNMGRSRAHNAGKRDITVAEEFSAVGIRCDDSVSDNFIVGKNRVTAMLRPDPKTREPRLKIFTSCRKSNYQMNHFSYDEWARYSSDQRDAKPTPRPLNDDFPKLFGYLANANVTHAGLVMGAQVLRRAARR